MHLMILGGTGAIGRVLIEHLAGRSPRVDVTVVSRTATDLPDVKRVLTGHFADLGRSTDFRRQLATVDAIVHLADGLSILQQRRHAFDAAEAGQLVVSSERLAHAARNARVPLFVTVGSIKALSGEEDTRVLVERSEPRSSTLYGLSKRRLEDGIARIFRGSATRCVILRPPIIYGPGTRGGLRRLLDQIDTPLPLPLGGLRNRRSLLSTRNLASAIGTILDSGRGGPDGLFHCHDGPPLSTTDIVTTLRQALGRPVRLFPPTAWGARAARHVPVLGPVARRLMGSLELSDTHFRRSFRWRPAIDTRTALAEMAASYAAEKGRGLAAGYEVGEAA